jgi:peptide/nickel transport system permease protein
MALPQATHGAETTLGLKKREASWKRLIRNRVTFVGLIIVVIVTIVAIGAPFLAPYPYEQVNIKVKLKGPSAEHWLGTDQFGRDVYSRLLYGAQVSLVVSAAGMVVALVIGVLIGGVAGYYGGWIDEVFMRLMDVLMAFPYIILGIAMVAVVGPSFQNLIFVIGIMRVPQFARIAHGSVLSLRNLEFVDAARSIGQRNWVILLRHILPNCISPLVVLGSLSVATAISAEASLSFLGLGIQPPMASWGTMLSDGKLYMYNAPWIATFPGIIISVTILGYNLLGDGLRDVLDPRMQT